MKLISGLAALGAGLFASSVAFAADPPDLVGTWKGTGDAHAAVILGAIGTPRAEAAVPVFGNPKNEWTFTISEQQGRAFYGKATSPRGEEETIVGVVTLDGKELTIAGDHADVSGEILDDGKIEFCIKDDEYAVALVACYVAAKE